VWGFWGKLAPEPNRQTMTIVVETRSLPQFADGELYAFCLANRGVLDREKNSGLSAIRQLFRTFTY
jgi:hypothetical protein